MVDFFCNTETSWNKFEVNISKQISHSLRVWRLRLSKVAKDKVDKVNKVNKMNKVNKVNKVDKVVERVDGVEDAVQGGG